MKKIKINKDSLLAGVLTGSIGIFITKLISLLYVIPFNEIAVGETVYYSYGYSVYSLILDLCLSGIPYAVATMVAKYNAKDDKATLKAIRKVSSILIITVGVVSAAIVLAFINPITLKILPDGAENIVIQKTKNTLVIITIALLFVPLLSYYRGFYQGLKDMQSYSFSQILEQAVRVVFLLSASLICVYAFNMQRIWAIYMAVGGASVGAIVTIVYYLFYDSNMTKQLKDVGPSVYSNKELLKELIDTSVPYLISTILTNSIYTITLFFFSDGMQAYGYNNDDIITIQGLLNYQVAKLLSIPIIIMSAFTLNIIPFITEAITLGDNNRVKELINRIITSQFFFTIPICVFMALFSKEVFYIMYGNHDLLLGASILQRSVMHQIIVNMMAVVITTMLSLQLRKQYLLLEVIHIIVIVFTFYPCLKVFGFNGFYISSIAGELVICIGGIYLINKKCEIDFKSIGKDLLKISFSCLPMLIMLLIHNYVGIDIISAGRLPSLLYTGFIFVLLISTYLLFTLGLNLAQGVFEITSAKELIKKLFSRFIKK